MPIVHAHILRGRKPEQRDAFAKAVTQAAETHLGVAPQAVRVLIYEIEPELWYAAGEPKAPPA
jgi:4-oxalocrotonate tautomerase